MSLCSFSIFKGLDKPKPRKGLFHACAVVESVKAASDVYSPLGGEVLAGNAALATQPELINSDPYGQGWILRLKPAAGASSGALMTSDAYQAEAATGD